MLKMMDNLPARPDPADLSSEIAALARRYRRANGPVMSLVTKLGGSLEARASLIPAALRARIGRVTETALAGAWGLAGAGARRLPVGGRRGSLVAAAASGALGGAGGLATSVAELPVTVAVILHAIRREAVAAGFDPEDPSIRGACLQVFAAGSPLAEDDGIDTSFLSARLTLTGPALKRLIATVAPRLAAVLTQKLAAQAIPVLGAVTGAALNTAFLSWYREIAAIRFALLRLAETQGEKAVLAAFRSAISSKPVSGA